MKTEPRIFSLDEANTLLQEIDDRLTRLDEKKKNCNLLHDEILMHALIQEAKPGSIHYDPGKSLESREQELDRIIAELGDEMEAIRALGCVVRNLERGWIDFLGRHEGRLVYFCWRRGEESIRCYHPVEGASLERFPLD